MAQKTKDTQCPGCGENAGVQIIYGLPSVELFEMAERGELVLGGCELIEGSPDRACRQCGARWRDEERVNADKDTRRTVKEEPSITRKTPRRPLFLVSPDAGAVDLDDDESIDRWAEQVLLQAFGVTEFAEDDED